MLDLDGLDGTNPMGLLAALGVLDIMRRHGVAVRLSWSDGLVPRARLAGIEGIDTLTDAILADKENLRSGPLLTYEVPDGKAKDGAARRPAPDVKFYEGELVDFLKACRQEPTSAAISQALVSQFVLDNNERSKPTDLHFTAGNQLFLDMARSLVEALTTEHLDEALVGPWRYASSMKSFMWDTADDRDYALSATNPASTTKPTVPGADWLAFRGLALFPILPGDHSPRLRRRDRILTPGAGGGWKSGWFTWPLWDVPISAETARTLMQSVPRKAPDDIGGKVLATWDALGVHRLYSSRITRSDQGGYGTFRPPRLVWSRATALVT